jgi:hypothetical protein
MKMRWHLGGRRALLVAIALAALVPDRAFAHPPKRAAPDYDGRGAKPTTAGDVIVWIPRVVLSPLYFTSEFLIRRPLGAFLIAAERGSWPSAIYNFFTFGPEHKAGLAPVAFVDFGFNPSVGLYFFWHDALFDGNHLRFHVSTWGSDWIGGSLTDRIQFRGDRELTLRVSGIRRPDQAFYGIGPSSLQSNQSRFGEDAVDGRATLVVPVWRASRLETGIGMRTVSLYHGHYSHDPSVEARAAAGAFPVPYGFDRGYTDEYHHILAVLDTRQALRAGGSGVRVEISAEQGSDLRRSPLSGWIRYGGTLGAYCDLNAHARVVSLSLATLFADPLGNQPIPFTELVALGGDGLMRGFYPGRLLGHSAAVATMRYRWPVGIWLDGSIQAAVGNVFGEHLDGFTPGLLRFSGALGLATGNSPGGAIEALVGFGSETFDHGGQVDSIRVVLGTNRGF